jgi:uncharacterized protein involved in outer membrane biogenesis
MQRKILFAIPVVLVAILIGVAIVLKSMDFNQYRDLIADEVRKATQRELVIGGDLDLALSLNPALAVSDVSLSNVPWGSRPEMAKIGRLEAQVALLPLLFGDIEIQRVALIDADLLLETDSKGAGNWVFGAVERPDAVGEGSEQKGSAQLPAVGDIELRNLRLTWRDGVAGKTTELKLDRLAAQADGPSDPLRLELQGDLNGDQFKVAGELSSFKEMISGGPLKLNLLAEAGGATVRLDGAVTEPDAGTGIDLKLAAEGADLATLSGLAGAELPPIAPWKVSLSLVDQPGGVRTDDLQIKLGESDVTGTLGITQREGKVPLLEAKLHSALLDLASLQGPKKVGSEEAAQPKEKKEKLFSPEPLALAGLKGLDAVAGYSADRLVADKLIISKLAADVRLADGVLQIKPLRMGIADSVAEGHVMLNAASKPARLELKLGAKGLDLGKLLKETTGEETLSGKGDLSIDLKGQGDSVAAIMGSLNGHSRLLVGEGSLKTGALDTLIGGLGQLAGTLVAEKKDTAVMNCLASDFEIKQGVATSRALLVDTEYSTVYGSGNINLGTETLDLVVKPESKAATLNVAVPVQIGGTLANPTFAPEKVATVRKAAGILAVVGGLAFPPAALMGLGEMGSGEDNPCLKIAQGKDGKPAPQPTEQKQETGGVKGALDNVGSKLKGLFGN